MNILLTSVGRRSYLVDYFRAAIAGAGIVVATNTDCLSPGMQAADRALLVKPSYEDGYIEQILDICSQYKINLLCSLHDLDGLVLSRHKAKFQAIGVVALVPDPEWADICLDKWKTAETLHAAGFPTPWQTCSIAEACEAIHCGKVAMPLLVKARHGFGSLGLGIAADFNELEVFYDKVRRDVALSGIHRFVDVCKEECVLIQEFICGVEHCVEVFNDLNGDYACHFSCRVDQMRAGESDQATTVDPGRFYDMARRISRLTRHSGLWELDVIERHDGRDAIIEINPRITGDYPFSHLAGANVPAVLVSWLNGRHPNEEWLNADIGVTGFKDLVPKRMQERTQPR